MVEGGSVAALLRLLLFALFVFVVVTIAAFVYLEWWQAILVSFATFMLLVYGAKLMVRWAVARIKNFASELFRVKSRVLRGATVDVHTLRPVPAPEEFEPEDDTQPVMLEWFEIEATIFPAPNAVGPMTHWDLDDLRLVPIDEPNREPLEAAEIESEIGFARIAIVENGVASEPQQSTLHGPQRLRFVAGLPRGIRVWKFRYYFEQFGRVELPPRNVLR